MNGFQFLAQIVFALIFLYARFNLFAYFFLSFRYFDFAGKQLVKSAEFFGNRTQFEYALFIGFFESEIIRRGVDESVGVVHGEYRRKRIFHRPCAVRRQIRPQFVFDKSRICLRFGRIPDFGSIFFNPYEEKFFFGANFGYPGRIQCVDVYPETVAGHTGTMFYAAYHADVVHVRKRRIFYRRINLRRHEQQRVFVARKSRAQSAQRFLPADIERSRHRRENYLAAQRDHRNRADGLHIG